MRAIVFILAAAIAASAQDPKAAALGAQLAREIRQRTTAIENPAVQDYIDRIGRKLAAQMPDENVVYQFALISDDAGGATHEPMSFPGGYIFVSASLIRDAALRSLYLEWTARTSRWFSWEEGRAWVRDGMDFLSR